jgi:hypothetical protein
MGTFNILKDKRACSVCGNIVELSIQFKYGEVWLYTYTLGDEIKWGEKNIGSQDHKKVLVTGITEKCPACNTSGVEYEILVESNKIIAAKPLSEKDSFRLQNQDYIILEK